MAAAGREGSVLLELAFGYAGVCCLRITVELSLHFCPLCSKSQHYALSECFFPDAPVGQARHSTGNDQLTLSREACEEPTNKADEQVRALQAPGSHLSLSLAEALRLCCTAGRRWSL